MRPRATLVLLAAGTCLPALAPPLTAQKARVGRQYYEDHHYGYKFRYPQDWLVVPVRPEMKRAGVIAQMEGPTVSVRVGNGAGSWKLDLAVMKFEQQAAVTREDDEGTGSLRGRVTTRSGRRTIAEFLAEQKDFLGLRDFKALEPETGKVKGREMRHQEFTAYTGDFDIVFHSYTFPLDDYDVVLLFRVPEQHARKWFKVFTGCAKTFQVIERQAAVSLEDAATASYDELLAYYKDQASRTEGWEVVETPSHRYILLTSSHDRRFLEQVTDRLERSRDLYEHDFPPSKPIQHVSLVRVCATAEEFHKYGGTGGGTGYGVLGWFNPATTELVIYDAKEVQRAISYGVMSHEGFHQYCHFLFDESEAHRWFDEGHGDYYAGIEFKGRKAIPQARGRGVDRLMEFKQILRDGRLVPVAEHVRMDHPTWQQSYGYPESWALIFFLREGMDGRVSHKYWRDEYATIIPNYMRVLHEGYLKAYEELREVAKKRAESEGREIKPEELEIRNIKRLLPQERKAEIWEKAIQASWGQVDLEEFEKLWLAYIEDL